MVSLIRDNVILFCRTSKLLREGSNSILNLGTRLFITWVFIVFVFVVLLFLSENFTFLNADNLVSHLVFYFISVCFITFFKEISRAKVAG